MPEARLDVDAPLPTYPFQHERFWPEGTAAEAVADPVETLFWDAVDQQDPSVLGFTDDGERDAVASALPALAAWRRRRAEVSTVDSWRYRVDWRRLGVVGVGALPGRWLVVVPAGFADAEVVTSAVDVLRAAGADCRLLELDGDDVVVPQAEAADPWAGTLSFLSLDERPHSRFPAVPTGVAKLAALLPALAEAGHTAPVWAVTTGATAAEDVPMRPDQALTWGLGLVAALEYPRLWGGLVDLPAEADARALRQLPAVLRGQGDEDQVAVRATGVFGRRLLRAPLPTGGRRSWTPHGTVLLTGGTGGVGGQIARRLAGTGAEHLLLLSRRGPAAEGTAELVAELEGLGTAVTVSACDVTDAAELTAAVAGIPAEWPLTAVVHAAGVGQQSSIADTGPAEFARILAGKVAGARTLDEVLGARPLDAFVLISSNAGVWGGGGQGAYAAANAYLDALATHRRALGRTATSIAWGSWGGAGLGAVDGAAERLSQLGVIPMDPELAVSALVAAVEHDETTVSIADLDWARFAPGFTSSRPSALLGELPEVRAALRDSAAEAGGTDLAARLGGLPEAEREPAVLAAVVTHAGAVLGHQDPGAVRPDSAFTEQGFDSMTSVQLRNALVKDFGLRLPTSLLFDHPTPRVLARFLLAELGGGTAAPAAAAATPGAGDDPVVIVGMACRLPGGIASPEDLWDLLAAGDEALSDFPADRGWDIDGIYDPEPGLPGKTYTRRGGFLDTATEFDPAFFKISPREALGMDPQQRIFLETAWEVFERAGVDVTALRGSRTGVFAGAFHTGYTIGADLIAEGVDGYSSHNNLPSVLSGRVAYSFGLEGPAVTVDTACSSSLVALHLAAQSLRSGESDLALAGGVAVMARPSTFVEFSRQRGLAADGRCKAFAAAADGTGWSEGVSVLLLERLSDARRNGHPILATVAGSAVNQDGASNGLTAPNGPSQQRVIRQALANAGLEPSDVDVVEAHGTGTTLGDPIEAQAVISTYGQDRPDGFPLRLGSLKSNIGHTQAAAGVAGVIKSVLALRRGVLPKTLHIDAPTPHVDWPAGAVELLTEQVPWPETGRPRRAGISAFGVSGTNAHVIVEQAAAADVPATPDATAVTPWVLSAKTPAALEQTAARVAGYVEEHPDVTVAAVATGLRSRARLDHRAVVVGADREELLAGLRHVAAGRPGAGVFPAVTGNPGKAVFVFPGQGTQWAGMCAGLFEVAAFADSVAECDEVLSSLVDWS
ncbi:type I polyketide synthase, partial [Amycolatopsis sp. cmx-8-4]|uniref:type I polyketide synthase n=1 Tax=Amycolatopsis sp. cmx-8-4 TaxID=2790947 RepID=UPI00397B3686